MDEQKNELKNELFVMAYKDAAVLMAKLRLTGCENQIIWYLMSKLFNDNIIWNLSQAKMGKDLNMSQAQVSRILKSLVKKGIVVVEDGHKYLNGKIFRYGKSISETSMKDWEGDSLNTAKRGKYKNTIESDNFGIQLVDIEEVDNENIFEVPKLRKVA